jgi:hypothetical protein
MVLQRLGGLSDREAVERFTFDARWRYAAGLGGYDSEGPQPTSCTPCWWRCGSGYAARSVPTGSSR